METKSFLFQGKKIHYKVYGAGRPVMLIHGFGEDGTIWQHQIEFLQPYFRLIVPDIPGNGQSELLPNADIETYADIMKELCDIELSKAAATVGGLAAVVGHSLGGYITLAFAEKYPQYLHSFALVHSTAFADAAEKKATRKKAIEFIREKGAYTFLKTSIPGLFTTAFYGHHADKVESLIEAARQFTPEALVQYYEAMIARPDRLAVLKNFTGPILFLIGEHDMAVPFQSSLQQCHLPDRSHVHILRQSAHMGMWEETGKVNRVLLEFLQQV